MVNAGAVGKSNNSSIFKNSNIRRKLALDNWESRQQAVI